MNQPSRPVPFQPGDRLTLSITATDTITVRHEVHIEVTEATTNPFANLASISSEKPLPRMTEKIGSEEDSSSSSEEREKEEGVVEKEPESTTKQIIMKGIDDMEEEEMTMSKEEEAAKRYDVAI